MSICTSTVPVNYGTSNWVAGHLPIRYQLESDKWPVNSVDAIEFFHSVTENAGFAQINLAGAYSAYLQGQYVQITDSTISGYNGVWQIKEVIGPGQYVLTAPYVGDGNGNIQDYYNNYGIVVRVYTGIRPGHYLAAERPMALRGTMTVRPGLDNISEADVSSYVKADLTPFECKLCEIIETGESVGNDWYQWTSFYIEYAETYDVPSGSGGVETFISKFTTDESGGETNYFWASNSSQQFQNFAGYSMGEYGIGDYNAFVPAKFMTNFVEPTYFVGCPFDMSIINTYTELGAYTTLKVRIEEFTSADFVQTSSELASALEFPLQAQTGSSSLGTTDIEFPNHDEGVYRIDLSGFSFNSQTSVFTVAIIRDDSGLEATMSEVKTVSIKDPCRTTPMCLKWQNYLGGWDYWNFTAYKDFGLRFGESKLVRRDVAQNWDTNFRNSDTEDDWIYTEAYDTVTVRSQVMNQTEVDVVNKWLRLSNKVFEVFFADDAGCGNYRQRTVLIDRNDITVRAQADKFFEISLSLRRTDQIRIPQQ